MIRKNLSLILIFSLVPLGPLAIDVFLPSMPHMISLFGTTEAEMGLTIPVYIYALGLGQLISGHVSDTYGRKASALIGLSIYALGSFVATLAPSLMMLYGARAIQGFGAAFTMITAMAWVRDNYEGEAAGKWLSYMSGLTSAIPMVAPMIGGVLALIWGWQSGFVFMGLIAVILLILAWYALERRSPLQISQAEPEKQKIRVLKILGNTQFQIYSLANMATFGGLLAYVSAAPIVAMSEGKLSEIGFATLFGFIGMTQIIVAFLAPRLVTLVGQRHTVFLGLVVATLGGVGLLFVPVGSTWAFFAMATLGNTGFSLTIGTSSAMVLQPFPNNAGLTASMDGFIRMIGGATIAGSVGLLPLTNAQILATALLLTIAPMFFVFQDISKQTVLSEVLVK